PTAVGEQFVEQDIPAYFAYARQFTLCDNYFTDVAGPSTPNHIMLITADSPIIVNPPRYRLPVGQPLFDLPSLPAALEKAGFTWGNYGGYAFDFIRALQGKRKLASAHFKQDAAAGKLPSVSWVYAPHEPTHPDRDGNHPQWSGTQFRYGSRVGCLVLSPYAKSGYISKVLHSHVSLLKFCETLFGLPHLNARDAKTDDMSDCFDFTRQPAAPPTRI